MGIEQDEYYNTGFNKKVWEQNKFMIGVIVGMLIAATAIKLGALLL